MKMIQDHSGGGGWEHKRKHKHLYLVRIQNTSLHQRGNCILDEPGFNGQKKLEISQLRGG